MSKFDRRDLKGSYDVRTFIAHDYEGENLSVIEHIIRDRLPDMKNIVDQILR